MVDPGDARPGAGAVVRALRRSRRPAFRLDRGAYAEVAGRARQIRQRRLHAAGGGLALVLLVAAAAQVLPRNGADVLHTTTTPPPKGQGLIPVAPPPPPGSDDIAAGSRTPTGGPSASRPAAPARPVGPPRLWDPSAGFAMWHTDDAKALSLTGSEPCGSGWSRGPRDEWCLAFIDPQHSYDWLAAAPGWDVNDWYFVLVFCRWQAVTPGAIRLTGVPRLRIVPKDGGPAVLDSHLRWPGRTPSKDAWDLVAGRCAAVGLHWDSRDDSGRPVPNGRYHWDLELPDSQFREWNAAHAGWVVDVEYAHWLS